MDPQRRKLALAMLAAAFAGRAGAKGEHAAAPAAPAEHDMSAFPANWMGTEQIAMLLYPQFTALDLVGPQYMLANLMGAKVHLVAKSREPVTSDTGISIVPSATFADCPADLSILFVPGGTQGTLDAMQDEETQAFLADRGSRAKYVTSVCTGSLVLGAAGLLTGYRATSHWVTRSLLARFGATPVNARVVRDRNRITGAGVTAGLDFGLSLVRDLRDRDYAESVQLLAEYDPQPPFNAGSPAKSKRLNRERMEAMFAGFVEKADAAARASMARRNG